LLLSVFIYLILLYVLKIYKGCTAYSQKVQNLIGIELINKVKEQHKSADINKCYVADIPKDSSLYTINKIKKVIKENIRSNIYICGDMILILIYYIYIYIYIYIFFFFFFSSLFKLLGYIN